MLERLNLGVIGTNLFKKAKESTIAEMEKFNRVRTRFFYPLDAEQIDSLELRTLIDSISEEFNIDLTGIDRNTSYFKILHTRIFDILDMKIHRLTPFHYLIVSRNKNMEVVFIIRDQDAESDYNIKVTFFNDELEDGTAELISFHATRKALELQDLSEDHLMPQFPDMPNHPR